MLEQPGTLVGMHPEGTRGKGPDPYELLRAQPGIGQVVLRAKPIVMPVFINGVQNDFLFESFRNYKPGMRKERPVIIVFGEPMDYSEFTAKKPRVALYKKCADRIREEILKLTEREKQIRAACAAGAISDDDPNWLSNRRKERR